MRGSILIILIVFLTILALAVGVSYFTGIQTAIVSGFGETTTPSETYVCGEKLGGLDRAGLLENAASLTEKLKGEELVIRLSDEDIFKKPLSDLGFKINPEKIVDEVNRAYPQGLSINAILLRNKANHEGLRADIPLEFDQAALKDFLAEVKKSCDRAPHSASYDFENMTLLEATEGRELDIDATLAKMPSRIATIGQVVVEPVVKLTPPATSTEDMTGIDPTTPLASFKTEYNAAKRNRCKNIAKLSEMFRGVTIAPGEQFSFNGVSGPRNKATGYLPAPEYRANRVIDGYGGGSCQVSTTLYNAALLAGMKIDRRSPHSRVVYYVPRGRDATVNYDASVDLKFTNVLKHPVVLWPRYDIDAGWLTFDIFGNPEDKQNIEIENSFTYINRTESMDQYIVDPTLPAGKKVVKDEGTNGIRVHTWRNYIQPDGSKIKENLFSDVIPAMGKIIYHNPIGGEPTPKDDKPKVDGEKPKDGGNYF